MIPRSMREKKLRIAIMEEIRLAGGHCSHVESHETSPGIPDIDFSLSGINGHIEVKVWTKTYRTGLRSTQAIWFRDRLKSGDRHLWILVQDQQELFLVRGIHYRGLTGTNPVDLSVPRIQFAELRHALEIMVGSPNFDT